MQTTFRVQTSGVTQKSNLPLHLSQHTPQGTAHLSNEQGEDRETEDLAAQEPPLSQDNRLTMVDPVPSTNGVSPTNTETPSMNTTATQQATNTTTPNQPDSTTKPSKKPAKEQRPQAPKQTNTDQNVAEAGAGAKLTGKQLKEQKKAEKAARRAEQVLAKGDVAVQQQAESAPQAGTSRPEASQRRSSQGGGQSGKNPGEQQSQNHTPNHKRKPSNVPPEPGAVRIPFRPGGGTTATSTNQALAAAGGPPPQTTQQHPRHHEKKVPLVSHLYPTARPASLTTATREIHPSVLTLALHLRSLTLVGSTARTLSLLLTLKRVIHAYTTPPNTALSRHLTVHISHQISFLSSARPLGIAQGNSIRWLKKLISTLDPDLDENEAKKFLCASIDSFIREKVTLASEVIASQASTRIEPNGETILVYGKSSVVEKTLLQAAREEGKHFKVLVVDSRPLFEGRNLVRSLLRAGMCQGGELSGCQVVYTLVSGLSDALTQHSVTKCFLGASGMLGNGGLYGRCGSALVAMMAKEHNVPVLVLAESVKFTGKMAVDSLSINEIANADGLVEERDEQTITSGGDGAVKTEDSGKGGKKSGSGGGSGGKKKGGGGGGNDADEQQDGDSEKSKSLLGGWREQPNLYLLNLMYDVTPKRYLDMVICELGTLPPGAVPVVNGVHGGDE